MGLFPWQFWRMTPLEFADYVDAWNWRDEQDWRRRAWQTAIIVNHWRKEGCELTVDDLLPKKDKHKEPQTVDQQVKIMEQWVAALGGTDKRRVKNG